MLVPSSSRRTSRRSAPLYCSTQYPRVAGRAVQCSTVHAAQHGAVSVSGPVSGHFSFRKLCWHDDRLPRAFPHRFRKLGQYTNQFRARGLHQVVLFAAIAVFVSGVHSVGLQRPIPVSRTPRSASPVQFCVRSTVRTRSLKCQEGLCAARCDV